jgi:predicted NUDIX family NTP pyrophosphohydrolase
MQDGVVATRRSAGLLLYRGDAAGIEVLLVHMGGPFWAAKDDGAWSIPKGEYGEDEDPLAVAKREFAEELGIPPPPGDYEHLGSVRQAGGKVVTAFARRADLAVGSITSNAARIEWPPSSGRFVEFPEVDRAEWTLPARARRRLVRAQVALLDRLLERVGVVVDVEDTSSG